MKLFLPLTIALAMFGLTACQSINPSQTVTSPVKVDTSQPAIFIPKTPSLAELQRYDWQLVSAYDNSQKPLIALNTLKDGEVTLNFDQNRMNYSVGCNQLSSKFSLSNNLLTTIGNTTSTLMACGNLQSAESLLANKMQGSSQLSLDANSGSFLVQTTADNSTLNWQGKIKPEAKYGKGETLFLEVAPQDEACDKLTTKRCLMVRDVFYDNQGIKTSHGQWHIMYEPIENYQKSADQGNVLRVIRYRTAPSDVKGFSNLYVLDGVIETTDLVR